MYDVIVAGGGSMGIAAAYFRAKQGASVLVLDKYEIPNQMASHHGVTRMLRLSYGHGSSYVPLALESLKLWAELETSVGKELYRKTGAITIGYPDSEFVEMAIESAISNNIPYKVMTADELTDKWRGLDIPDDYIGCFDPSAGFLYSEDCLTAYKDEALKYGAEIHENEAVVSVEQEENFITVKTDKDTYHGAKVIVTAGAWLPKLLPELDLKIQPVRKTISWFKPHEDNLYGNDFPCYIFDTKDHGLYYGFPDFDDYGVKLGSMDNDINCEPDELNREYGAYEQDENDDRAFLERYMPQAAGELIDGKVCMFSRTPDDDFIIDVHPENPNIILAGGFSGHGFKFASAIGSILSDLSVDGTTTHDISTFKLSRFSKPDETLLS